MTTSAVVAAGAVLAAAGGATAGSTAAAAVTVRVWLAGHDPRGLAAAARAVSDPDSPAYGRYLTPAQVRARYGPTSAEATAVRGWLTGAGLRITRATAEYLDAAGTVGAVQAAFGPAVHRDRRAAVAEPALTGTPTMPAAVAPLVLAVSAAGDPAATAPADPPAYYATPSPCSHYWGEQPAGTLPPAYGRVQPYAPCGYRPAQLRQAYGVTATGLTGRGARVAIVDPFDSPTLAADVQRHAAEMGDQGLRPGQFAVDAPAAFEHTDDGLCGAPANWYREESVHVETVHELAPDARISLEAAASCTGDDLLAALDRVVEQHSADIVSASWGWGMAFPGWSDADVRAYEQVFEEGALEGIGFYFATGDCSDLDPSVMCAQQLGSPAPQLDYPAADPWVTAVGGTSLAVDAAGRYAWEAPWSTIMSHLAPDGSGWQIPSTFVVGEGGGGVSDRFAEPFYQRGVVPSALARSGPGAGPAGTPRRVVPDLAAVGDYFGGVWFGQTVANPQGGTAFLESPLGGTRVSLAVVVGVQADAEQAAHRPLGFANPALYRRAGTLHDVVDLPAAAGGQPAMVVHNLAEDAYAVDTLGQDGPLRGTPGYDAATGLGTPSARYLRSFER